jgi:two-component system, chemotaxis family, protein-glutamate methylesterase/glutaminase
MIAGEARTSSKAGPVRVLVVDDSALSRLFLSRVLSDAAGMEVVGALSSGPAAVEFLGEHAVDVVTMDVVMPGMDGYEATRRILSMVSVPVVIVSSQSNPDDRRCTFAALDAGAVAFVAKPAAPGTPQGERDARQLVTTVRLMSEVKVVRRPWQGSGKGDSIQPFADAAAIHRVDVAAIGVSTGGPPVLRCMLANLPANFRLPILIAQHISAGFVDSFTRWLDSGIALPVHTALPGERVVPGHVYVAPGGQHMVVTPECEVALIPEEDPRQVSPSADRLFASLAQVYGRRAVAFLLSGMGRDGAAGLLELRHRGAVTVAQDEESCVVYGMPREAVRMKAVRHVLNPEQMSGLLITLSRKGEQQAPGEAPWSTS